MPSSWHSHREGLGREGGCDFSPWQRAADWMRSQASGRSMAQNSWFGYFLLPGARKQSEAPPPFRSELWVSITWTGHITIPGYHQAVTFPRTSWCVLDHQEGFAWLMELTPDYVESLSPHPDLGLFLILGRDQRSLPITTSYLYFLSRLILRTRGILLCSERGIPLASVC